MILVFALGAVQVWQDTVAAARALQNATTDDGSRTAGLTCCRGPARLDHLLHAGESGAVQWESGRELGSSLDVLQVHQRSDDFVHSVSVRDRGGCR